MRTNYNRSSCTQFKTTIRCQLKEDLMDLGMQQLFGKADLTRISPSGNIAVSKVIHKAYVDVDEEGTEAAAATVIVTGKTGRPQPVPAFRADHPFLFLIRDHRTGGVLFVGRVVDPS